MDQVVFPLNVPSHLFTGRLMAGGKWHTIEIDSAEPVQIPTPSGTAYGVASFARIFDGVNRSQFCVLVDPSQMTRGVPDGLNQVKTWIPKCAVMIAAAVVGGRQQIPENGVIAVTSPDYAQDPQRSDPRAFRRRCRFDVLAKAEYCINSHPQTQFCSGEDLLGAKTYTRMYERDDFVDAIQFWQSKGYLRLQTRGLRIQINGARDDDIAAELATYSWDEACELRAEGAPTLATVSEPAYEYDVFISHASEDKADVVVPLTEALTRLGLRVWVDYRELRLGDRLRQRIDEGLVRSRFGVVIVSPQFLDKRWTQAELDGLVSLEMADGRKRILPVWHAVSETGVAAKSPLLVSRLAANWSDGLDKVATQIIQVVRD